MENKRVTRRQFMRDGAIVAAGVAVGLGAKTAGAAPVDTSKILNYNPNMEYRRQGKTNLMVSAVCLGGHSRSNVEERTEIVSRAIDIGINYIDACTKGEVVRDSKALKGRRDKMYLALSHCGKETRNEKYRTAKKLLESLDEVLTDSGEEYTDLWRVTCYEPGGRHSFDTACEMIEALETAKKQGKARFIGFSTHDRRWIKFMIEFFPQVDCVCFPFTTMSKRAQTDSVFEALKKEDVGAFGIKPFAAGSLFTKDREQNFQRARLAIRYILHSNTVIPIPGLNSVEYVDNVAKAVAERRELDVKEAAQLDIANKQAWANLPANYQWLKNWQQV
ncbi:MAG: aldo/keto reductase [Planctomycetes bacterium]|nr:aldo/keto reductase [Planctomycetota bacterium]MBL7185598.1 aldo/keto reductase [Phycisphaerae bacterium]